MSKRTVYLDYAAATPLDPEVLEAMLPYLTEKFENPSAPYARARAVRADYDAARNELAHSIGARADNLVITAGATEANNLALACAQGKVAVAATEHESVLAAAQALGGTTIPTGPDGRVASKAVRDAIGPETSLVSISLANGELGCIQPIREIAAVIAEERSRRLEAGEKRPILLHTDASQAARDLSIAVSSLGCDLMTLSAAKVYGPKRVGLLWAADGVELHPIMHGGGQERGLRSGTEDVAGAVGFARALTLAQARRADDSRRLRRMRDRMQHDLLEAFPDAVVSGPHTARLRLPDLLHISFPGCDARRLVILLEREGVSVGTGSACAASRMRVSHVLEAIGMPEELAAGSLRISLGRPTSEQDAAWATKAIIRAVRSEQARVSGGDYLR